jgi:hypothetical protein
MIKYQQSQRARGSRGVIQGSRRDGCLAPLPIISERDVSGAQLETQLA